MAERDYFEVGVPIKGSEGSSGEVVIATPNSPRSPYTPEQTPAKYGLGLRDPYRVLTRQEMLSLEEDMLTLRAIRARSLEFRIQKILL